MRQSSDDLSLIRTLKRSITCNLLLSKLTPDGHQNSEEVHNLLSLDEKCLIDQDSEDQNSEEDHNLQYVDEKKLT